MNISEEDLRGLFDLAVESMDFTSGFWENDDVLLARRVAEALGIDPMLGTPKPFKEQFCPGHEFVQQKWVNRDWLLCIHCEKRVAQ